MLARSPTGSGKTIAFGIPLVQRIDTTAPRIQALVLVPTRELALQVADELATLDASVRVATAFGGVKQGAQVRAIRDASVLVACPGRLLDLLDQREVSLDHVSVLVLDEADRMLDMGFAPSVERIIARVPSDRQTLLFSATLDDRVAKIAARCTVDPVEVSTAPPAARPATIDHAFLPVDHADRMDLLVDVLMHEPDRDLAVVFVRTKRAAPRIARKLAQRGLRTASLHGDMAQGGRQRELGRFERGDAEVLVATDVFARGLDLDRITLVVNYDPPAELDDYVHRSGRTGRAGRDGLVVTFVMDDQRAAVEGIAAALDLREEYARNGLEPLATSRVPNNSTSNKPTRRRRRRPQRSGSPA